MKALNQLIVTALAALLFVAGSAGTASADPNGLQCNPNHRAAMTAFAEQYIDFYNNLGAAPYTTVYHEDAVLESTAGVFSGVDEIAAIMLAVTTAIPDLQYTLEEVLVDGNNLIVRYSYSGTHLGPFLGIPASGNPLKVYGLEINVIEDGKIAYTKNFTDFFGLLAQMGAIAL